VDGDDLNDDDLDELDGLEDLLLEDELDELLASTGIGRVHRRKPIMVNCVNFFNIQ
jgi:hypothetical protein